MKKILRSVFKFLKLKLNCFRSWLEFNKIFFEIIGAASLSFMAIFISITANSLTEKQTKIMEYENTPQLEIRTQQIQNPQTKIYDKTVWLIFNRNSKLSNFEIEKDYSLLTFTKARDFSGDTLSVPIHFYLNTSGILTGENEGLIYQFDNAYVGEDEFEFRSGLRGIGYIDVHSYIKITYNNIFDEKIEKFYKISPSIKLITSEEWKKIEKFWIDNTDKRIYLDDVEKFKEFTLKI